VLDCESRLRSTLAHEMCHVAAWVVDREFEPHHGRAFKAWAARFQAAVAGVDITTRHDYAVFRPFKWECTDPR
jgi:predicted SprT family Zn-dependent metalloprotease